MREIQIRKKNLFFLMKDLIDAGSFDHLREFAKNEKLIVEIEINPCGTITNQTKEWKTGKEMSILIWEEKV